MRASTWLLRVSLSSVRLFAVVSAASSPVRRLSVIYGFRRLNRARSELRPFSALHVGVQDRLHRLRFMRAYSFVPWRASSF